MKKKIKKSIKEGKRAMRILCNNNDSGDEIDISEETMRQTKRLEALARKARENTETVLKLKQERESLKTIETRLQDILDPPEEPQKITEQFNQIKKEAKEDFDSWKSASEPYTDPYPELKYWHWSSTNLPSEEQVPSELPSGLDLGIIASLEATLHKGSSETNTKKSSDDALGRLSSEIQQDIDKARDMWKAQGFNLGMSDEALLDHLKNKPYSDLKKASPNTRLYSDSVETSSNPLQYTSEEIPIRIKSNINSINQKTMQQEISTNIKDIPGLSDYTRCTADQWTELRISIRKDIKAFEDSQKEIRREIAAMTLVIIKSIDKNANIRTSTHDNKCRPPWNHPDKACERLLKKIDKVKFSQGSLIDKAITPIKNAYSKELDTLRKQQQ